MYYYVYNLQGDVTHIMKGDKTIVGTYTYDAWGKITNLNSLTAIAQVNPFRYRGYYYDTESGLYYLNSRYYNPEWGRFINADSIIAEVGGHINGYNLFAYCVNNPVNMSDTDGHSPKDMRLISSLANLLSHAQNILNSSEKYNVSASSIANHVNITHVTTPQFMLDGGYLLGKIGFSLTDTYQSEQAGLFYTYTDIGDDACRYGAAINVRGWAGIGVGVSSELNAYVSLQLTPYFHIEASVGFDGIGGIFGFDQPIDNGNISYDFEVKGGLGLIGIFYSLCNPAFGGNTMIPEYA